jgi:hypothetical protein
VSDQFAEADLIVRYRDSADKRVGILIENKIGAAFQPRQAERYQQRGEQGKCSKEWDRYFTCLIAPSRYIEQGHGFQKSVSFESVCSWISAPDDARRAFRVGIISTALEQSRRNGPKVVDEAVTEFRRRYYEFLAQEARDLLMNKPKRVYSGETWFVLKHRSLPKGVRIVHKSPMGFVDLAFPNRNAADLGRLASQLEYGMEIRQTGKSAAIRLSVPSIEKFDSFDAQRDSVRAALDAAMRLAVFCVRERESLAALPSNDGSGSPITTVNLAK